MVCTTFEINLYLSRYETMLVGSEVIQIINFSQNFLLLCHLFKVVCVTVLIFLQLCVSVSIDYLLLLHPLYLLFSWRFFGNDFYVETPKNYECLLEYSSLTKKKWLQYICNIDNIFKIFVTLFQTIYNNFLTEEICN